ncbi:MAG TPA: NAD(P)-dependent alcohol dehydrogenase [Sphingobium sp.]|nr:NAD(P)-dependent alcohol dehydrogenase [Sphingobium sp.]
MKVVEISQSAPHGNLRMAERADPAAPGRGEIKVRLRASSLNFHDYGVVSLMGGRSADGLIPLSDGAGEVLEVGEGVDDFAVGDLVISTFFPTPPKEGDFPVAMAGVPGDGIDGFARELVTAPASGFTRAPAGWTAAEAATVPCAGLTAWRALFVDGGLVPGRTVLVQGTGGVSIYALQLAKAAGCSVIATSSSPEKMERLKALGADHVINYRETPEWGAAARALTGGRGVDHVVEIGGAGTLPQSLIACAPRGHIALIGSLAGYSGELPTIMLVGRQIRMQGLLVGTPDQQRDLIAALETNGIRPVIDSHFPLDRLADAFDHQLSGKHFGKIAIDI